MTSRRCCVTSSTPTPPEELAGAAGLAAIEDATALGINVNATVNFTVPGALAVAAVALTLTNSTLQGNRAIGVNGRGGAVWAESGALHIAQVSLLNNNAKVAGGAEGVGRHHHVGPRGQRPEEIDLLEVTQGAPGGRDGADEPLALGAVAGDALGVEDRLDVSGVMNDLAGEAVPATLDQIARLRLRNARRPGKRHRCGGGGRGSRPVGLPVTARAGTDLPGGVIHVGPLALQFPEVLVQGLKKDAAVGGHDKVGRAVLFDGHEVKTGGVWSTVWTIWVQVALLPQRSVAV